LSVEALQWQGQRTAQQVIEEREDFTCSLERAGAAMWASGVAGDWYAQADPCVQRVSEGVNGLLFDHLATITSFGDSECVQFFRKGAPFVGELPACGIGPPVAAQASRPVAELRHRCYDNNVALLSNLREDSSSRALFDAVHADAQLGRMSEAVPIEEVCLHSVRLAPRFAVQKAKESGEMSVRPIDNFSWSELGCLEQGGRSRQRAAAKRGSVNGYSSAREQVKHDHLDKLLAMLHEARLVTGVVFALFKADIDAAFRRIPIAPGDWWAAWIVFLFQGQVRLHLSTDCGAACSFPCCQAWAAAHKCCPFGALSAVFAWERVGALLVHIVRKCLKLAVCRYVDDFFGCERCVHPSFSYVGASPVACRPETIEHALGCFMRIIRLLLGQNALASHKVSFGSSLCVLGVDLAISAAGIVARPSATKVVKWVASVREALRTGVLSAGDASKLAGRLQWAAQSLFNRLGRALLRDVYDQQKSRCVCWASCLAALCGFPVFAGMGVLGDVCAGRWLGGSRS
jgi:hypothetical protein